MTSIDHIAAPDPWPSPPSATGPTRRERRRAALALAVSLLVHALLFSLAFGDGSGLPGLGLPWRERRAEVPELHVRLAPEPGAVPRAADPLPTPGLDTEAARPTPPVVGAMPDEPGTIEAHEARPPRSADAMSSVPPAPALSTPPIEARRPPDPSPDPSPARDATSDAVSTLMAGTALITVDRSDVPRYPLPRLRPAVATVAAVAPAVAPSASRPEVTSASPAAPASAPPAADPSVAARSEAKADANAQAKAREASRREAERLASAREAAAQAEARRIDSERAETARQRAASEAALQASAQREAARAEAERLEAARQAASQAEAERLQAARQAAAREDATKQEAARVEATRLEAIRQAAARQDAARAEAERIEAARQATARQEAERAEAARLDAERAEAARQSVTRQAQARQAAQAEATRLDSERQAAQAAQAAQAVQATQATQAAQPAQTAASSTSQAQDDAARHEARLRALGRQLDADADRRDAEKAARFANDLPTSLSTARRGRLLGRTDPNAELVLYAEAWARRIQLNMSIDRVRALSQRPHKDPLVTVALRKDGSVETVTFVMSSGVPEIDQAIREIVQGLAPYPSFPPALAREYDVVEIRRTWYLDTAVRLY